MKPLKIHKIIGYFVSILILMVSCIEDIEEIEPDFEKLVSAELGSWGHVALELDNGDLVVVGQIEKAKIDSDVGEGFPAITVLDPEGNFKYRKIYPIDSLFYVDEGLPWEVKVDEYGVIADILPLDNGNYAALLSSTFYEWWGPNFTSIVLILNPQFNLLDAKDISYTQPNWRWANELFKFDNGDIGVNVWRDYDGYADVGTSFSLVRLLSNGDFVSYNRFPLADPPPGVEYQCYQPIKDKQGNLLVNGTRFDHRPKPNVDSLKIYQISSTDLSVLKDVSWGIGGQQHFGLKLFHVPEGYIMVKKYDTNDSTKTNTAFVDDKLGFNFFDENLNFIREVRYDDINVTNYREGIQTPDGGVVSLIRQANYMDDSNISLLIKVDPQGTIQWQREFEGDPAPAGLIELRDGSLIVSIIKVFNTQTKKLVIKRVGSDGN